MISSAKSKKIKVGIVDDHALFKVGIKVALSLFKDIEVIIEAEDGSDLLHQLQSIQPDVILLDLQMPKMDGVTALPILKKKYPSIKIIILSIYDDDSLISKTLEMGACSYVSKTADPGYMYDMIVSSF